MGEFGRAYNAGSPVVKFGYTMADLDDLARIAVHLDHWWRAADVDERHAAAWSAIAEKIVAATSIVPTRTELIHIGRSASDEATRHHVRQRGMRTYDTMSGYGAMITFQRYWFTAPSPSPEHRVVERRALGEILPLLPARQREALTLLAALGDHQAAADAMGITRGTFSVTISNARRNFLRAWHEGEEPSRIWRTDRRTYRRNSTLDCTGKERLTAAQVEHARDRIAAGETQRAVAAALGVSAYCLSQLLRGRSKPVAP